VKKDETGKITGKILACSIIENEKMLGELWGARQCKCKPSIPNLIYQYCFYCNYKDDALDQVNEEIGS